MSALPQDASKKQLERKEGRNASIIVVATDYDSAPAAHAISGMPHQAALAQRHHQEADRTILHGNVHPQARRGI